MLRLLAITTLLLCTLVGAMVVLAGRGNALARHQATEPSNLFAGSMITVTTTTDEQNNDGDCSLREAIQAADTDTVADGCAAGNGGDTINLPAGVYLLSGSLTLTNVITLQGSITDSTILDAHYGSRVLYIEPDAVVTLSHLEIRNGQAPREADTDPGDVVGEGGGILNFGTTLIAFSTIQNNHAGLESWDLHGGADGTYGGGIFNAGILTVTNSTISGNKAGWGWGGLSHGGQGGALATTGRLTIINSTIANNEPGTRGGPCGPDLVLYLNNLAGGIYILDSAQVEIENSILADNLGRDCGQYFGSASNRYTLHGNNLIQTPEGCLISGNYIHWAAHLSPLQDNGGPTYTHALSETSPAIDAGSCLSSTGITVTIDQRGEPRPQGEACDIGAFESPYTSTFEIRDVKLPLIGRQP